MPDGLKRFFLKHKAEPMTFAVEADDRGNILGIIDVTDSATKGGLCPHLLDTLPLVGRIDDADFLNRTREEFDYYAPDCANTHHLLNDLLELEKDYRIFLAEWSEADGEAKRLKKRMEAQAEKVHELLQKIQDRKPLPLFEETAA